MSINIIAIRLTKGMDLKQCLAGAGSTLSYLTLSILTCRLPLLLPYFNVKSLAKN